MEAIPSESVQLVSVPQRASLARERVRLSTHLTWLFDVKTQLPHRGNKLRLVFVDLHISLNEANQIFTMNDWTANYLVEGYGIDKCKIHSVGFGINLNPMTEMKFYDNNLLLIVLRKGNERLKGMYLVIDAFRILKKKNTK